MRRIVSSVVVLIVVVGVLGGVYWFGARGGWFGVEYGPGTIEGKLISADIVAKRGAAIAAVAPQGGTSQILFGDLHVHTTISADAFQFALPLFGASGAHPIADACDFARYCSGLDFWAATDHAESITPKRWQTVKDAVRACQRVAGDDANPDLVSFIGFEWTQVGRTPDVHFGHHNVIFRDLADEKVSRRPIAAGDMESAQRIASGISPLVPLADFENRQTYFDYNKFMSLTRATPACDANTPSDKLPADCMEWASRPRDLIRRLFDEQKLSPLVIPHGTTWGLATPPGVDWSKALLPSERADKIPLFEIYSGHGNSEEFRAWSEVSNDGAGKFSCPKPSKDYLPSCWRAGELILERCLKAKLDPKVCSSRAAVARQSYVDMMAAGHLAVPGAVPEDWLDAGQCTDCFLPSFNYRPGKSAQAALAQSHFEDGAAKPRRFNWGFIGSSDTHRARPGTGYKQLDRRENTDTTGPTSAGMRALISSEEEFDDEDPHARSLPLDRLQSLGGIRTRELERQSGFFLAGGLAAVHAEGRSREQIFAALERREVYATSGQKILLWFNAVSTSGAKTPMGGSLSADAAPTFEVHAVGAFKQEAGCPDFAKAGLDEGRLKKICSGECDHPSDERRQITRIEVVKIRPQATKGEALADLVQDRYIVHTCKPGADGCTFTFTDPDFAAGKRDALYYVKAIQEAEPIINADPLKCERDAGGRCIKVNICYGDYRSGASDCTAPAEPRAWSSPIYVNYNGG